MSTRTLIAAMYVFVGSAVLLIAFLTYRNYYAPLSVDRASDGQFGTGYRSYNPRASRSGSSVRLLHDPSQIAHLQQRLNALESNLQETSATLGRQTTELRNKNEECLNLQADLDESLTLVFELLAEESFSEQAVIDLNDGELGDGNDLETPREKALDQLREELRRAEFLDSEQAQQIEELRTELMRAEAEVADIQLAAEQELDELLSRQQDLESVAAELLIQTGKPIVPALVRFLDDHRSEVRAFAAYVLGEIGADAEDASTTLLGLLSDPNQTVRDQSRQALAKITPMQNP